MVQLTPSCGSVAPFGRSVLKHSGMFLKRKALISRYALHLAFSESQPHICVSCHIERDAPDGWAPGSQKHRAWFLFWTWVLLNRFVKCNVLWVIESCRVLCFEEEQVLNKVGCQQGHSQPIEQPETACDNVSLGQCLHGVTIQCPTGFPPAASMQLQSQCKK